MHRKNRNKKMMRKESKKISKSCKSRMAQHPHVIQGDTLCWVGDDLSITKHGWPMVSPGLSVLPRICPEEACGNKKEHASLASSGSWLCLH